MSRIRVLALAVGLAVPPQMAHAADGPASCVDAPASKAALVEIDGRCGGLVFFIDGDKACTPMAVPNELLAMMDDVATAKISHEGSPL